MERAEVMIMRMISPTAMLTICRLIDCRIIVAPGERYTHRLPPHGPARSYIQEPARRGSISLPARSSRRSRSPAREAYGETGMMTDLGHVQPPAALPHGPVLVLRYTSDRRLR